MAASPGSPRLLLVKPKMIGDTLLLTPTLRALRRELPTARIDVLVRHGTESILAGCDVPDHVLRTAPPSSDRQRIDAPPITRWWRTLRATRYDLAIDLSGNERGRFALLAARARRKVVGPPGPELRSRWFWQNIFRAVTPPDWSRLHEIQRDARLLEAALERPLGSLTLSFDRTPGAVAPAGLPARYAVIHPGSRVPAKLWPAERWEAVARHLAATCGHVVLSSGPAETEIALARQIAATLPAGGATVTAGAWSWSVLAETLRGAAVFVGADTAAAHLAAATGVASVVVWGPALEHRWAPWHDRAWIVAANEIVPAATARQRHRQPGDVETRTPGLNQAETVIRAIGLAIGQAIPAVG